jgi:tetratricopeptide (TPR) repeat protein
MGLVDVADVDSLMDSSEHILRQLRWLKWLNALIAFCFVVIAGSVVWLASEAITAFQEDESSSTSFMARGLSLLEEGNEQEVLKLSDEREKKFPKDPYVHWYRGKAHYQLGHLDEALKAIRHVHELEPSWRESLTAPYIKAVEEEIAKGL